MFGECNSPSYCTMQCLLKLKVKKLTFDTNHWIMEIKKVNKVESLKKVENIEKVKMIGYANVNTLT